MALPQDKIDRLAELLLDQTIHELELAAASGEVVDPRRLANARGLLESTSSRALEPKAAPVVRDEKGKPIRPADEAPKGTPENPWPGQKFPTEHQLKLIAHITHKEEDRAADDGE